LFSFSTFFFVETFVPSVFVKKKVLLFVSFLKNEAKPRVSKNPAGSLLKSLLTDKFECCAYRLVIVSQLVHLKQQKKTVLVPLSKPKKLIGNC